MAVLILSEEDKAPAETFLTMRWRSLGNVTKEKWLQPVSSICLTLVVFQQFAKHFLACVIVLLVLE